MPRGATTLIARHLRRTFGEGETLTVAVDDASFEVQAGEVVLLMGPSGSGKSTLLAMLAGLLAPESGQVLALGEDLWAMSERERERFRLRHCGFIFQGYNLFTSLTAREQLELVARWEQELSPGEARKRVSQVLELLGLGSRGDLMPGQLSGGEKQRVAVGRALLKNPEFHFADEPTSALDWQHGEQVVKLLREAAVHGATVVLVTHDARLLPYADRVVNLRDGRLVSEESTGNRGGP